MKILVLTKRHYTNKDLIDDRYGRCRELPLALAQNGNTVKGLCLSYVKKAEGPINDSDIERQGSVTWHCLNLRNPKPLGIYRFYITSLQFAQAYKPDIVLSFSDTIYAILGVKIAKECGSKSVIDLYDNFESFASAKIPGMLSLFYRALKCSDAITVISDPLKRKINQHLPLKKNIATMINGTDSRIFFSRDKQECRSKLQLPPDVPIIGTVGALSHSRGISMLFDGYAALQRKFPNIHVVLAGKKDADVVIPQDPNIHYLGELPFTQIPEVLCALDVGVVCNKNTAFGNYCFPQKAVEMMALGVPLAAASLGSLKEYLADYPELLFEPTDVKDFVNVVSCQLENPHYPTVDVPSWQDLSKNLELFFTKLLQ